MTTETAQVDAPQTTAAVAAVSESLPDRPPISAPAKPRGNEVHASERERAATARARHRRDPAGLPVAALLGIGAGGLEPSLRVLGPLSMFSLSIVAMIAF